MNNRIGFRLLSLAVFSLACSLPALAGDPSDLPRKFSDSQPQPSALASAVQSWTGLFGERKIGVFIESFTANQIRGYSMVGQNKRPFQGSVRQQNGIYLISVQEPMTHASDGVFEMRFNPASPRQLSGTWQSRDRNIASKSFSLTPRACTASKTAGEYDGSVRRLTGDELQTDPWTLSLMRNEIYARHGYAFADREIAAQFAEMDWYIPCYANVESKLSSLERSNIQKLRKAEAYAEKQDWGR